MNLDVCLQYIEKAGKNFAIANWQSDVVSRIHVYAHLERCKYAFNDEKFISYMYLCYL